MIRPVVSDVTEQAYGRLAPIAGQDEKYGWALLTYLDSIGIGLQRIEPYFRDTSTGPGWSLIVDAVRCPDEALPYLAQLVGVDLTGVTTAAAQRTKIQDRPNTRRGRRLSLVNEVKAVLTGTKSVYISERNPTAYSFQISVVQSEVSDYSAGTSAKVKEAILRQKPGGLQYTLYFMTTNWNYAILGANYADYTNAKNTHATYAALTTGP